MTMMPEDWAGFKLPGGRTFFEIEKFKERIKELNVKRVPLMEWTYLPNVNK